MPPIDPARRLAAALVAGLPLALAWRFALAYRVRAGYPRRNPPVRTPGDLGLAWEALDVPVPGGPRLPAWFIPASAAPGPAVVILHGWESARDRVLPHGLVLHAIGLHVLLLDVRGHGANAPEERPVSAGEYAADARAAVDLLLGRPDVERVALLGHSMGGAGVLLAAAEEPRVAAVVAISAPADPYRLTRQTFRLARLPLPAPVAWPLAWLATHALLGPRGHRVAAVSATNAVRRIAAPVLLVHGEADRVIPPDHMARLAAARRRALPAAVTDTLLVAGAGHSWHYELPAFRAAVAAFLATALGGPLPPPVAAEVATGVDASRFPEGERLMTLDEEPGGLRSLLGAVTGGGRGRRTAG